MSLWGPFLFKPPHQYAQSISCFILCSNRKVGAPCTVGFMLGPWAGETAQQLKALAADAEGMFGSQPPNQGSPQMPSTPDPGNPKPLLASTATTHTCTHKQQ